MTVFPKSDSGGFVSRKDAARHGADKGKVRLLALLFPIFFMITALPPVASMVEIAVTSRMMDTVLTMDLSEIRLVEKEERCLITVDADRNTSFEQEVELITAETEKYRLGRLHEASCGSMISVADPQTGSFDNYSKLFIEIPFLPCQAGLPIMPKGKY